jgi:hypothetical protein
MIPLSQCQDHHLYQIQSRNLSYGVFDKARSGFVGIRTKFGNRYLATEYHWDIDEPYGTVQPIAMIELCPVVNIAEDLGTHCNTCKSPVIYNWVWGGWQHENPAMDKICHQIISTNTSNRPLFYYLESYEKTQTSGATSARSAGGVQEPAQGSDAASASSGSGTQQLGDQLPGESKGAP